MTSSRPDRRRVFIDASAFIALGYTRDQFHHQALATRLQLARVQADLFTTNFILAEVHAMLVSRRGPVVAFEYLNGLDTGPTNIVRVTEHDEKAARDILSRYRDKAFSLTDALSFVVMEAFGITTAFSFDDDFRQYGFEML